MILSIQPITILQIVFICQAIFGLLLVGNEQRFRGLRYLLILVCALMVFNILEENRITYDWHLITPVFSLLSGPVFFWFVHSLLFPNARLTRDKLLHLLPALFALPFTDWVQVILMVGTLSQVAYCAIILGMLRRYHHETEQRTSDSFAYRLDWIKQVVLLAIVIGLIDLLRLNAQPWLNEGLAVSGYFFTQLCYLCLYAWILLKSVRNSDLFADWQVELTNQPSNSTHAIKRAPDSQNDRAQAALIYQAIYEAVTKEELFRQPRFSIRDLSNHMGIGEKDCSWAINEGGGQSFSEMINGLRVDVIKQAIEQSSQRNFLNLALEAGFNSKTAFNSAFKQFTGQTPSEFAKSLP